METKMPYDSKPPRDTHAEAIGDLATVVAHELRNPLAGISATVQLVLAELAPGDRRRTALERVLPEIARMDGIVEELLAFSRHVAPDADEIDLAEAAREAVARAEGSCDIAQVVGSGRAIGDLQQVASALRSLILNACQSGATVVQLRVADGRIDVFDDGPGVPEELGESIFRPFITTRTRGTGLGLPSARRAVEAMNGTLEMVDSPLSGAGFRVTLPIG